MNQEMKQKDVDAQVNYLGRWVSKKNFRAFVYSKTGAKKLVENYDEYEKAIMSREWYAHIDDIKETKREATKRKLAAVEPVNTEINGDILAPNENELQTTEA